MRKIFTLTIAILLALSVVLCFTACKGNGDDSTTTTQPVVNSGNSIGGYSAEVTENSLKVYKNDVFVEELTYPENKKSNLFLDFAKNHIAFKDMDFDGNLDICVAINQLETGFEYCCWIYDAKADKFVYNETLSSFTSITLDNVNKQVISTVKNDGELSYVVYEWKNGKLEKLQEKDELPETVTDNVIGAVSSNNTTSRNPENSGSQSDDKGTSSTTQSQGGASNNNNSTPGNNGGSNSGSNGSSGGKISYGPDQFANTWY